MTIQDVIKLNMGKQVDLEPVETDVLRLYAPFFHEDGDMYSIYLEKQGERVFVRDYGNTLMRVSYTFEINTENKKRVLNNIVKSNLGTLDDGELIMETTINELPQTIYQYSQLVAKVSNIDILGREVVRSLFYDYLREFVLTSLTEYKVLENHIPTSDKELVVDYVIPASKPLFLFGVNDDVKASRATISCLKFQNERLPFRSVIVHEDFDGKLSVFNRNQITNASDKQFTSLDQFKNEGLAYIKREIAA